MTRRAIRVPGLDHGATPIPTAAMVGPLLVSGGISGIDRATGELPSEVSAQVRNVFANVAAVLAAAGGTVEDVVKFNFFVPDRALRSELNPVWTETFPDPDSQPARHVNVYGALPSGMHLQCEVIAYIQQSA
jgi:2-iminobutanoate/2-iminopropanoate deaminase